MLIVLSFVLATKERTKEKCKEKRNAPLVFPASASPCLALIPFCRLQAANLISADYFNNGFLISDQLEPLL
jgi:hypothetical protein